MRHLQVKGPQEMLEKKIQFYKLATTLLVACVLLIFSSGAAQLNNFSGEGLINRVTKIEGKSFSGRVRDTEQEPDDESKWTYKWVEAKEERKTEITHMVCVISDDRISNSSAVLITPISGSIQQPQHRSSCVCAIAEGSFTVMSAYTGSASNTSVPFSFIVVNP